MKREKVLRVGALIAASTLVLIAISHGRETKLDYAIDRRQVPKWSADDLNFFLHGTMSTEVVPETVLRAFIKIYPDLFPASDLSNLGMLPDPEFGWPIGFSRRPVKHLGNLPSIGLNCAACHVAEIHSANHEPVRVLGVTSHFDAEAFFGAVTIAGFRTVDPANMKKFLTAYAGKELPNWDEDKIKAAMANDPSGAKGTVEGELQEIVPNELNFDASSDLAAVSHSFLKLFHNMRAALHIPDQPPEKAPPTSGPGRNDAFGLLSAGLFNAPQPFAPVKFGLVWNVSDRHWVHWDGNTRSPIGRNLLASLGLGAPLHGKRGELDFAAINRQTEISEMIKPPPYPFAIDQAAAKRGAAHFEANCASCHGGEESDKRLYSVEEVGTDPLRARLFTAQQAGRFNKFLAELEAVGYTPAKEDGLRSTGKYWAASMGGVWARAPYLHNGSVRTVQELLTVPNERSKSYHRGSHDYDEAQMGYTDGGAYIFDTAASGNSNSGHDYGTKLGAEQKHDLMEYLKTL
ncbi:MAG: c-type cytochrome [Chthoniobacterales bacterium]